MTIALNIHEFYNELKEAGFTEKQSEVIANIQNKTSQATIEQTKHDYRLDDITTNKDLDARIKETELKIEIVKSDLQRDIESVRKEISDSKYETIKWIAAIVLGTGVAQIFAIIGLLKLLGKI